MGATNPAQRRIAIDDSVFAGSQDYIVFSPNNNNKSHPFENFFPRGILIGGDNTDNEANGKDAAYADIRYKCAQDNSWETDTLATHVVHPIEVREISVGSKTTARKIRIYS